MNAHEILGVAPSATPEEVKKAYRKLAKEHHPDRHGGSVEAKQKFQQIQEAYDSLRGDKPKQDAPHAQQGGFDPHVHMHEIFEEFFNRQRQGNPTLSAHCAITLEQAFTGCTVSFNINGKAVVVNIPAGIDHGQTVRVQGAGGQQNPNFPPADLHVTVMMHRHERFVRHGMTLLTGHKIGLLDLLTGCEIEIDTITGGKKKVTVPANSTPNDAVQVHGEGMKAMSSEQRGDLLVRFEVEYPTFTDEQLETLRGMRS